MFMVTKSNAIFPLYFSLVYKETQLGEGSEESEPLPPAQGSVTGQIPLVNQGISGPQWTLLKCLITSPVQHVRRILNKDEAYIQFCVCVCMRMYTWSLICVWLFATTWTVACQAPLSMGFSSQEYWRGLPFPPPGDLPDPGIKPASLVSLALAGRFFTTEPPVPADPGTNQGWKESTQTQSRMPVYMACQLIHLHRTPSFWEKLWSLDQGSFPQPLSYYVLMFAVSCYFSTTVHRFHFYFLWSKGCPTMRNKNSFGLNYHYGFILFLIKY